MAAKSFNTNVLGGGSGTGTVTSVAMTGDDVIFNSTVSGSPITISGTLAPTLKTQPKNTFLVGPVSGSNATPTFRLIDTNDLPININAANIADGSVSNTEFQYLDGVTSGIQTQIDGKQAKTSYCDLYSGIPLPANTYNNGASGVGATLTANANGALTVAGTAVTAGMSILVNGESTAANNGIYTVTATGGVSTPYTLTRRSDFNSSTNIIPGIQVFVVSGTSSGANTEWILNNAGTIPVVVGTTTIHFTQTAGTGTYTATGGITLNINDFSLTTIGTGGSGGSASVVPVFGYNTKGQVTGLVPTSIQIAESQVTGLTTDLISAFRSDTFTYSHAGGV